MFSRKLLLATTVLALTATAVITRAQDVHASSPSDSVADAARKARAQKKDAVKPAKVFTDDNVGDIKGQISVVGAEPAPKRTTQRERRTTRSPQMRPMEKRMRPTGEENLPQRAKPWPTTREKWTSCSENSI